jgi:hypothetical protein
MKIFKQIRSEVKSKNICNCNCNQLAKLSHNYKEFRLKPFDMNEEVKIFSREFSKKKKIPNFYEISDQLKIRAQFFDWLIVVCRILNQNERTYYLTVEIFDEFFDSSWKKLNARDIRLYGITSLFIASKVEEINPLKLKIIVEQVGHELFNKQEILKSEKLILIALKYKLPKLEYLDIFVVLISQSFNGCCFCKSILFEQCKIIYKLVLLDYIFIRTTSILNLCASILIYSTQILNKKNPDHILNLSEIYKKLDDLHFSLKQEEVCSIHQIIKNKYETLEKYNDYFCYLWAEFKNICNILTCNIII